MILSKFLKKDYYFQNNKKIIDDTFNFLSMNDLIFNDSLIYSSSKNNQEALYNFSNNLINIPNNFYRLDKNYLQVEAIKKHLGDKTLEFIIKHEFGHLNHHQFLSLQHNINSDNFEYVTLNSNANYIKTNTSLDKLFDRTLSKSNPIEDFIHMNFMESYSDSYVGLTSYLQDKDKSIFAKIHNLRLSQFKELKDSEKLNIKQNANNNSAVEIYSGKLSTSRYFNYLSSKYIKENIIEQFNFEKLNQLFIYDLHDLMQIEVLSSLQETLKKEIKNNPLFNKQFSDYLQIKNISITDYFKEFSNGILEYKENTYLNLIHNELLINNQDKLNEFINFHANNISFQSSNLFTNFLTTQEEQDLHRTIQNLKNNKKLEQNKEGLSKYLVDKFILPKNNFLPLIQSLISNKSNQNFNEIIKSLDNNTKQYLLNSYNGNSKIKIEPLPQLQNHSQRQLMKIFTDSLNDKNKKEFNNIMNQYEIKEISTPYLTSSFNAHVLTNEQENNLLKSKKECLLNIENIDYIRNKCLNLSNNNFNQKKIKY